MPTRDDAERQQREHEMRRDLQGANRRYHDFATIQGDHDHEQRQKPPLPDKPSAEISSQ